MWFIVACPPGAIRYRKSCYYTNRELRYWDHGRRACDQFDWMGGGSLAKVDTFDKAHILSRLMTINVGLVCLSGRKLFHITE